MPPIGVDQFLRSGDEIDILDPARYAGVAMTFVTPKFSRGAVRRAGDLLRRGPTSEAELSAALEVLNNWRSAHLYPINTFQATLRKKLKSVDKEGLVGQRLKRAPSIVKKLQRYPTDLEVMQDIAGLRAIVADIPKLTSLHQNYLDSPFAHELKRVDNYVLEPKTDGYRSVHLIYKYSNALARAYDGLRVELQLRTKLQHAWATAVETIDTFMDESIKAGKPSKDWATFFKLASAAFSHMEKTPILEEYRNVPYGKLINELRASQKRLDVITRLAGFTVAAQNIKTDGPNRFRYHLVILNKQERKLIIRSFPQSALAEADAAYAKVENEARYGLPLDPVLVTGGNVKDLRRSFPNYFLDTQYFSSRLGALVGVAVPMRVPLPPKKRG
jgi:ppGpp synthetase/RelA/SpoT-type nucleotidyltranferase